MSTSAAHAQAAISWKQEVNRRLAEHREHKPAGPMPQPQAANTPSASRRAREAAARVAARYANAPSFQDVLANEARAALKAAQAASAAALEAQAAAEQVLAGLVAANSAEPAPETSPAPQIPPIAPALDAAVPARDAAPAELAGEIQDEGADSRTTSGDPVAVRWAPELPSHRLTRGQEGGPSVEAAWRPASAEPLGPGAGEVQVVEPAPIYGNLIEFPRELVAARRARPRLTEPATAHAPEHGVQLSIFEVDPVALPAEPAQEAPLIAEPETGAAWEQTAWSGLELEPEPEAEVPAPDQKLTEEPAPSAPPARTQKPAAVSRRLMAALVDGALMACAELGGLTVALNRAAVIPGPKTIAAGLAMAALAVAALYFAIFFTLSHATPGMRYARLRLATLAGETPRRTERWARLAALAVSVLAAGLGVVWALVDKDRLGWQDRLSGTYLVAR